MTDSPFLIDTRDLGRRPGATRRLEREIVAAKRFGNEMIGVPAGGLLELDLRLDSVVEGVLVTGTATGAATGECGRCLRPITQQVSAEVSELFAYPGHHVDVSEDDEAEPLPEMDGDIIDLESAVTDAIVPAMPFQPLCRPDCAGLCPVCGVRLDDAEPGHHHEGPTDPRWDALKDLGLGGSGE